MMNLFGKRILDEFAGNTPEYTALTLGDTDMQSRVQKKAMDNFMAMLFLSNFNKDRFGEMLVDFMKSYANKDNKYPQLVADIVNIMRQQPERRKKQKPSKDKDKVLVENAYSKQYVLINALKCAMMSHVFATMYMRNKCARHLKILR